MLGIQQKILLKNRWIKFDKFGYEGLSEVLAYRFSKIIESRLNVLEYNPIRFNGKLGCVSLDVNKKGCELISLLELFEERSEKPSARKFIDYYIPLIIEKTLLSDFGEWLTDLFFFDMLIQNEDRNPGNILLYRCGDYYKYAPVIDNANSLLYNIPINQHVFSTSILAKPLLIPYENQCQIMMEKFNSSINLKDNKMIVSDLTEYYSKRQIEQACCCLADNILKYFGVILDFY